MGSKERIGNFISLYELRNSEKKDYPVVGINRDKTFMPTVANLEGVDTTKYKVISNGIFVFSGMQTGRDIEYVKQFLMIECSWYNNSPVERDKIFDIMEKAYDNDDIVLFGINCDGDYYFINSRQTIVDNLVNFGKKEENA